MSTDKKVWLTIFSAFLFIHSIYAKSGKTFTVMSYNAENLFDTIHDEGKKDYTYLPLKVKQANPEYIEYCKSMSSSYYREHCLTLDWTEEVLDQKIKNLSQVIKNATPNGSPDILVLQEVENIRVLKQLRDQGLKDEGYNEIVLIEGPDSRGIDVGILSKLPLSRKAVLHTVNLTTTSSRAKGGSNTRGILEATFKFNNSEFIVMGNHWPSQMNSDQSRVIAAKTLSEASERRSFPVIALGDFNTAPSDDPNAIEEYILNPSRRVFFKDSEFEAYGEYRGTHHYGGKWTSLDRIFVLNSKSSSSCRRRSSNCIVALWDQFEIIKEDYMLKDVTFTDSDGNEVEYKGVPMRFNPKTGEGYSDHLPVVMKFEAK